MNDELTKEDMINLGEIDPEEPEETPEEDVEASEEGDETPEPEEPEGEEGEPEPEPEPEEETAPVPVDRFNKVYGERKEIERKFDLFKRLGSDKYYELYPNEKPTDAEPVQTKITTTPSGLKVPTLTECLNLPVEGGLYDGRTLGDLFESDDITERAAAIDLYNEHRDNIKAQVDAAQSEDAKIREKADKEHNDFYAARAKELFGKKYPGECDNAEIQQISDLTNSIMGQMEGMGVYNLENAYRLLTLDDTLKNARGESIKSIIELARKGKVTHIATKKSTKTGTGYDALTEMTPGQVLAHLDTLSEEGLKKFWEKATPEFVAKHKDIAAAWT